MSRPRLLRYINSKDLECCQKTTFEDVVTGANITFPVQAKKGDVHIVNYFSSELFRSTGWSAYVLTESGWVSQISIPEIDVSELNISNDGIVVVSSTEGLPTGADPTKVYYDKDTNQKFGTNGTFWVTDGKGFQNLAPSHTIVNSSETYTGVETSFRVGEVVGDTETIKFENEVIVNYRWNGSSWATIFVYNMNSTEYTFSTNFPIIGTGVTPGSIFKGVDGALYYKGDADTVTLLGVS